MNKTEEITKKKEPCCGPDCCSDEETSTEKSEAEIKEMVKEQYSKAALQSKESNDRYLLFLINIRTSKVIIQMPILASGAGSQHSLQK